MEVLVAFAGEGADGDAAVAGGDPFLHNTQIEKKNKKLNELASTVSQ